MKHFNFWALALTAICMAACTSEDDLTQSPPVQQDEEVQIPIMFSSNKDNTTRANVTGVAAADSLGRQFVVSGYKGPKSEWSDASKIVFDNYVVNYIENSAFTTESNVANWEYVDRPRIKHAIDKGITRQSIKYWDYTEAQYDFIAWSTGKKTPIYEKPAEGIPTGSVLVSAITPATATGTGDALVAYTFTGKAVDLKDCYIADMVTVKKADYSKKTGENPVTLTFRQLGTKVRIGIYETVPGYSVRNVQFYSAAASNDADATKPRIFTTVANKIYTEGTYTVYFPTVDTPDSKDNNQAHIKFSPIGDTQETVVNFGALNYTIAEDGEKTDGAVYLGRSSNTASFAGNATYNYYTFYLPNEEGTNLNLRVNYTLESIDGSGETINVKGATAQIPSIYTAWQSGFAYTYLFKISDKTNGYTGVYDPTKPDDTTVNSDPAGLYPITFDAIVVNAEDGDQTQETITTISTPSITTYQNGSNVVNNDEYKVLTPDATKGITGEIYVTVNDGETANTPDLANGKLVDLTGKAKLYTIPAGKTEAEVIDALQIRDDDAADGTVKGRSGLVLTEATGDNALSLTNEVKYGADGNSIIIPEDGTKKKAAKFLPAANTTYAFVYTKTAATTTTDKFEPKTFAVDALVKGYYRYGYTATTKSHSYIDNKGTVETSDDVNVDAFDAQKGVKYFSETGGVYKMETAFIGQGVSNLYLDAAGNAIAKGYAKSGTDYYYTTDHGMSYKKATNIAYEAFGGATLYKDAALTIAKPSTETKPLDGQAYYDATGTYCVILPQQVNTWKVLTDSYEACGDTETAIDGQTYFDKFTQNNGVYYTKVIKVQP